MRRDWIVAIMSQSSKNLLPLLQRVTWKLRDVFGRTLSDDFSWTQILMLPHELFQHLSPVAAKKFLETPLFVDGLVVLAARGQVVASGEQPHVEPGGAL